VKKLNLGSGNRPMKGYTNIDNQERVNPDRVLDLTKGLPFESNSIDEIRAFDFLEHIHPDKVLFVMEEIWRALKPGGVFESFTPDAEFGQGAFQDPTQVSFWTEGSWKYFSDKQHRDLYGIHADFEIAKIERLPSDGRVYHLYVQAVKREAA